MTEGAADVSGNPLYWWQGKDNNGPQLILHAMPMDRILDLKIGHVERMMQNMMVMVMTEITRIWDSKKYKAGQKSMAYLFWLIVEIVGFYLCVYAIFLEIL